MVFKYHKHVPATSNIIALILPGDKVYLQLSDASPKFHKFQVDSTEGLLMGGFFDKYIN
jgi:hypothetical protein